MAKKVILKDVATLLNGRAYKQDELLDSGKYAVLRVGNFFSNRGWFYSDLELDDDKYCDNGDLLFAWSASFGPKIWDGGKVIYHYHIWKIITTPQIDKKYFYYYLENAADRIKESGHGIAMIHTTKSEMEQMELLLPEMEQQLQIAAVLDKISELISLRKQQLAKLDELVKARFVELFGDTVFNPFGWKKDLLGAVCDVRDGTHDSPQYYETGYPLVTSKNVTGGKIDLTDCSLICEADFNKINERSKVDIGDIIMPMIGTVGKPVIVDIEPNFAIKNVALIKFKVDSSVLNIYIRALLQSDYFDDAVLSKVRGGTQKFISLGDIRKLEVLVPPMELQQRFVAFVEQTDKSKLAIQQSLDKLETLKKSLMQKYFG